MDATESECRSTESFMRSAVNNHPRHPVIEIKHMKCGGWAFLDD
uniref:Uncharacterized protein n=1 Tax=Arundo donax TaxID=35708 RepID=A0A0A8XY18_ARUDO